LFVSYYRNGGRAGDGKWIWYDEGIIFTGENIIFADIDGDGRADIAVRGAYGKLEGHLNVGPGTKPKYRLMGDIASGDGDDASPRIELRDLNGDGRADYLNVKKDGSIQAYINMLSEVVGADPLWVPIGAVAGGVASRDRVVFGDLDGDGKTDYIVVDPDSGAITLWQNQGSGSTYRAGQNIYLADLNGDGKDDYLIVSPAGAIEAYMNGGASGIKWIWVPNQAEVASGVAKRANIRYGYPFTPGTGASDKTREANMARRNTGSATWTETAGPTTSWLTPRPLLCASGRTAARSPAASGSGSTGA
jgi:hypothetical protein